MAEHVEYHSEEAIPELESMLKVLLTEDEIRLIVQMRQRNEYNMRKAQKSKADLICYINDELNLLQMVQLRYKEKDLPKNKLASLEMGIGNRINKMYNYTIRLFPSDLSLWLHYFKFCRMHNMYPTTRRFLDQMLQLHGSSTPKLYLFAADWEENECKSIEGARKYLLQGIHVHKDNKELATKAFCLELNEAVRQRRMCAEKSVPIDPTNPNFTSKKAECIYEHTIKRLKDIELMNELMKICEQYDFTSLLQSKIYNDMLQFDQSERMWDIIAQKELDVKGDEKLDRSKLGRCVELYEAGVKKVNTVTMWSYYIETLEKLHAEATVLPNFKRKLLVSALSKGASQGKLTEAHYLTWIKFLAAPEKQDKLMEVLEGAVKQLPQSVKLWTVLLHNHFEQNKDTEAYQVFDQAIGILGKDALPLWRYMLLHEQARQNSKVEELFKKGVKQCPEISNSLKPMFLDWLIISDGIDIVRKQYAQLVELPPPCLDLHRRMVYLESIQPVISMKRMRTALNRACTEFGNNHIDVWIDTCKFELKSGEADRVSGIYYQACQSLHPDLLENFTTTFNLMQTIPNHGSGLC